MDTPASGSPHLSWANVGIALSFIVFNTLLSNFLHLDVGFSLLTAALRCVVQLAIVGTILRKVFEANNPWAVAGITFLLNLLGTIEIFFNKAKKRHDGMFPSVLLSMLCSTIPISIIGARFAMSADPFWTPSNFIPVVGMLCGSTINGIIVSTTYVLKELSDNRHVVETYLAYGASRTEATRPILISALRFALTPTINQMSVLGIIAIPGMMTGAILGGADVEQAAKLQTVIMFMISASTALASIISAFWSMSVGIDGEHRVRVDRIQGPFKWPNLGIVDGLKGLRTRATSYFTRRRTRPTRSDSTSTLLSPRSPTLGRRG
ncbi:abc transporter [Moniliophthora roreri MCA 2997]|uniref:Abc transporter n=1 Tax=Moniliophthora roreri (strain MCA 2997) TaxID=1381753 RepID=V2XAC2_MONRO|nr:abc transporter [Moniliophthora roreri MCA 2997]